MSGKLLLFWAFSLLWLILDFFMSLEYNPEKDRTHFLTGFDASYFLLTGILPVALGALGCWMVGKHSRVREDQDVAENPDRSCP